ncbi:unnamed protein product [Scytosiphon promiscuus]
MRTQQNSSVDICLLWSNRRSFSVEHDNPRYVTKLSTKMPVVATHRPPLFLGKILRGRRQEGGGKLQETHTHVTRQLTYRLCWRIRTQMWICALDNAEAEMRDSSPNLRGISGQENHKS